MMTLAAATTIFIICFTPQGVGPEECGPPITTAEIGKAFDGDLRVYRVDMDLRIYQLGTVGFTRALRRLSEQGLLGSGGE
jgi:hypothetical protein